MGDGSENFPKNPKEIAKKLNTDTKTFEKNIKPEIKIQASKFMEKINTTNPDIGFDKAGRLWLKNPQTGRTIPTDLKLEWFSL